MSLRKVYTYVHPVEKMRGKLQVKRLQNKERKISNPKFSNKSLIQQINNRSYQTVLKNVHILAILLNNSADKTRECLFRPPG